eukprot:GHVU01085182.1.p3 GENE.GHVU01085182.1~~GHVU01085182.1.p3  ORF type:complete len:106 (+),score=8.79 GHVU01085182.1:53-370(+)
MRQCARRHRDTHTHTHTQSHRQTHMFYYNARTNKPVHTYTYICTRAYVVVARQRNWRYETCAHTLTAAAAAHAACVHWELVCTHMLGSHGRSPASQSEQTESDTQ